MFRAAGMRCSLGGWGMNGARRLWGQSVSCHEFGARPRLQQCRLPGGQRGPSPAGGPGRPVAARQEGRPCPQSRGSPNRAQTEDSRHPSSPLEPMQPRTGPRSNLRRKPATPPAKSTFSFGTRRATMPDRNCDPNSAAAGLGPEIRRRGGLGFSAGQVGLGWRGSAGLRAEVPGGIRSWWLRSRVVPLGPAQGQRELARQNGAPEKLAKTRSAPESKTLGKLYVVKAKDRCYVTHRNVREGRRLICCVSAHPHAFLGHPWPGCLAGRARPEKTSGRGRVRLMPSPCS